MPKNYNKDDADPMGLQFMRRVVERASYANGQGTLSTLQCGHTSSGPSVTDGDLQKPCLTCEHEAEQNGQSAGTTPEEPA